MTTTNTNETGMTGESEVTRREHQLSTADFATAATNKAPVERERVDRADTERREAERHQALFPGPKLRASRVAGARSRQALSMSRSGRWNRRMGSSPKSCSDWRRSLPMSAAGWRNSGTAAKTPTPRRSAWRFAATGRSSNVSYLYRTSGPDWDQMVRRHNWTCTASFSPSGFQTEVLLPEGCVPRLGGHRGATTHFARGSTRPDRAGTRRPLSGDCRMRNSSRASASSRSRCWSWTASSSARVCHIAAASALTTTSVRPRQETSSRDSTRGERERC